jgi:hypothetical protein
MKVHRMSCLGLMEHRMIGLELRLMEHRMIGLELRMKERHKIGLGSKEHRMIGLEHIRRMMQLLVSSIVRLVFLVLDVQNQFQRHVMMNIQVDHMIVMVDRIVN